VNPLKYFKTTIYRIVKQLVIFSLCFAITGSFAMPYISYATTQDDVDDANDTVNELKKQQDELTGDITKLNAQLEEIAKKIDGLDAQINEKQLQIDELNQEIAVLEEQKDSQYQAMKLRIKYMYERSNSSMLDILLTSKNLSELLTKTEYIEKITEYDRQMLSELENIMTSQKTIEDKLATELDDLQELKTQTDTEQQQLKQLLAQKQKDLDTSPDKIKQAEKLAMQYEQQLRAEMLAKQLEEERKAQQDAENGEDNPDNSGIPLEYDATDLAMLAAIIECEAGNQPYKGMLAVGSVVINRVVSPRFGNSISAVLYAPYQFSPVGSGRFAIVLARGASAICTQAARDVLNGNIVINAFYFHVYNSDVDDYGTVIGDHIFY
jgi:peptidoglycan hydrolase CwlO-like protein